MAIDKIEGGEHMNEVSEHLYSKRERDLLRRLDRLFIEWQRQWDGDTGWFVWDGFYPGYLNMSKKILFLGRDSYDVYNNYDFPNPHGNYISDFIPRYQNGCMDDGKNINRVRFHKLLLQVAYGLLHNRSPIEWQDVLDAKSICENGLIFDEVSFAFMNLAKVSHESCEPCGVNADWAKIDFAVDFSTKNRNFIREEVELLAPDLIIAMNLNENPLGRDYYKSIFGENIAKSKIFVDDCTIYEVTLPCMKHIPLLDCWHFSGRFSEEIYIYRPIINALRAIDFYKTYT
jgi:hypothetical protein